MKSEYWFSLVIVVLVAFVLVLGSGYWVQARQHMDDQNGQMMKQRRHGHMMGNGDHRGMMKMPMVHADMSQEDMNQFCNRMQQHHEEMQQMRQENTERLNSLVRSMKQARGTEKIVSMEKILVELVDQHNKRSTMMMKSMRSMMGSMMGMHQMNPQQRQQMMRQMRNCPMMEGMMNSGQQPGTRMPSPSGDDE